MSEINGGFSFVTDGFSFKGAALAWEQEMRRFARKGAWASAASAAGHAMYWWGRDAGPGL